MFSTKSTESNTLLEILYRQTEVPKPLQDVASLYKGTLNIQWWHTTGRSTPKTRILEIKFDTPHRYIHSSSWYMVQQSTRLCMRPEIIGEHNVVIDRWYKYVDVRWKIMALKVENEAGKWHTYDGGWEQISTLITGISLTCPFLLDISRWYHLICCSSYLQTVI